MQFAVLKYAHSFPSLSEMDGYIRISEELEAVQLLSSENAQDLREAYKNFRLNIHQKALQNEPPLATKADAETMRNRVISIWNQYLITG